MNLNINSSYSSPAFRANLVLNSSLEKLAQEDDNFKEITERIKAEPSDNTVHIYPTADENKQTFILEQREETQDGRKLYSWIGFIPRHGSAYNGAFSSFDPVVVNGNTIWSPDKDMK